MKKMIFIALLVIPLCKAADDPYESWIQAVQATPQTEEDELILIGRQITAIPDNLDRPLIRILFLENNQITSIPEGINLPNLEVLSLENNQITSVDPQIRKQFPKLSYLNVNKNPLTQKSFDQLKKVADTIPDLLFIADDIGEQYLPFSYGKKAAKH